MIKCHLSRIMGEKKLKIADVARDTGLNRGTITRLYQETAVRVEFDVLERIYIGRRFRNDTERLEKLFELYTKMTSK
jgi:putative transcriptional regulator